ncbi:MAG: hypothetical protein CMC08_00415 [Flavobacteriaceae bacterium]|nr:hypothetical protein [Flavobacteriaceae bacterium]
MIPFKNLTLVAAFLLISVYGYGQQRFTEYNYLGITGGLTQYDINTDQLNTEAGQGFMFGFHARGAFYNNFDLVYGINFYNSTVGVYGERALPIAGDGRYIEYNIQSALIHVLLSVNIVRDHLTLEAGPLLNVSGKLKLDDEAYADYILDGYNTLRADDIQDVSKVNFRVMGGLTAGFRKFKLNAQYQYGVTNMLNNLNEKDLSEIDDIEGHSSTLVLSGIFYF